MGQSATCSRSSFARAGGRRHRRSSPPCSHFAAEHMMSVTVLLHAFRLCMWRSQAMLAEFKLDYNQRHFVRNETFKNAAEKITVSRGSRRSQSGQRRVTCGTPASYSLAFRAGGARRTARIVQPERSRRASVQLPRWPSGRPSPACVKAHNTNKPTLPWKHTTPKCLAITLTVSACAAQGPARKIFVEFLERSCTAEFSGFLLYKELGRRLKTTNPVVAEVGTESNAGKERCNKSVELGKAATEVSRCTRR